MRARKLCGLGIAKRWRGGGQQLAQARIGHGNPGSDRAHQAFKVAKCQALRHCFDRAGQSAELNKP
jgi:hypothetical protein